MAGDIILQVNEQTINTSSDLPPAVGRIRPNTKGKFLVLRNGARKTLTIKVGERSGEMQLSKGGVTQSAPVLADRLGLKVEVIPAGLKEKWSVTNGVQVAEVSPESAAAAAGIRRGDVLVSIASKDIVSPKQFAKLVEELAAEQTVAVRLVRRGSPLFVALRVNE